jgi:hypothetical protein
MVSVVYNFQTVNNKIKLRMKYERVIQTGLFGNAVLAALMSVRKLDVIPQNDDCSKESDVRPLVFGNKVRYGTQPGKFHLQIMLSDVGCSSLNRLAVFVPQRSGNPALHRKMWNKQRHATVVSGTPVGRSSAKWIPVRCGLVLSENFITFIFLGAALGVRNQFRGSRPHWNSAT